MALIVLFAILGIIAVAGIVWSHYYFQKSAQAKGLEFLNKRMAQGMFPWAILFALLRCQQ